MCLMQCLAYNMQQNNASLARLVFTVLDRPQKYRKGIKLCNLLVVGEKGNLWKNKPLSQNENQGALKLRGSMLFYY